MKGCLTVDSEREQKKYEKGHKEKQTGKLY